MATRCLICPIALISYHNLAILIAGNSSIPPILTNETEKEHDYQCKYNCILFDMHELEILSGSRILHFVLSRHHQRLQPAMRFQPL
jgi:hypothetical protein